MEQKNKSYEKFEHKFNEALEFMFGKTISLMEEFEPAENSKKLDESTKQVMNVCKMHDAVNEYYQKIFRKEKSNNTIIDKIRVNPQAMELTFELLEVISIVKTAEKNKKLPAN